MLMASKRFEYVEKQADILEEIAAGYPRESPQYLAIENAAFALLFAISEHFESFVSYVEHSHSELTEEQKENLRKMGISI